MLQALLEHAMHDVLGLEDTRGCSIMLTEVSQQELALSSGRCVQPDHAGIAGAVCCAACTGRQSRH